MDDLFRLFSQLLRDDDFRRFQCDVAGAMYDELARGYMANEDEVSLVGRMVRASNGQSFRENIRLYADKIHGKRSFVTFPCQDRRPTKELGDLAVISIASRGGERLVQRVCIIQNKKRSGKSWSLDLEQLFLLKNFPPMSGNEGLLAGQTDLIFRNHSQCLGAYGLLEDPGEMLFLSAPLLAELRGGKKSVSMKDLCYPDTLQEPHAGSAWAMHPFFMHSKRWMILEELWMRHGMWSAFGHGAPFLGNSVFLRDLHDFTRGWTQLNIGELTYAFGERLNPAVDAFASHLMRSAGIKPPVRMDGDNYFSDLPFDGEFGVIVMHVDVDPEKKG